MGLSTVTLKIKLFIMGHIFGNVYLTFTDYSLM